MDTQLPALDDAGRYVQSRSTVNLRHHNPNEAKAIAQLVASVFADSEGHAEGALIGKLAKELFETTDEQHLLNYVADDDGQLVGTIFFSSLTLEDSLDALLLAPVAVHSDRQRSGIGQALIRHGLKDLKKQGVRTVITYGDPTFYQKVGFHQISHAIVKPPFKLSQPEGWLGQSLVGDPIETVSGRCSCVAAFGDPVYW